MIFPKDSAGRLMTTAVPVVEANMTAGEVERLIRMNSIDFDTVNYIYIVNQLKELIGVISIKELFTLESDEDLTKYVNQNLVIARPHTDQQRVAQLSLKHNIKAVPVVSKEHVFLGVVPSDKILAVLNQEHTEAVFRLAGVNHKDSHVGEVLLESTPFERFRMRLPWLILGLLGGVLSAVVIGLFEETLAKQLILAAFVPTIVYMADAVGSQSQMLFIRALSIEQELNIKRYVVREFLVNFFIGSALALLIFIVSLVWVKTLVVSVILATSILITVCFTVVIALALPLFFRSRGYDPAIASGPLSTVVHDGLSLCIYLLVASIMLNW